MASGRDPKRLVRYTCDFEGCSKEYSRPCRLEEHKKTHFSIKEFICTVESCSKAYYRSTHLKAHIDSAHATDKKFKCSKCPSEYSLKHHLTRHKRHKHENVKFPCTFEGCRSVFDKKKRLHEHLKAHLEPVKQAKIHVCDCGKEFDKWSDFVTHRKEERKLAKQEQKQEKEEGKSFICEFEGCSKSLSSKSALTVHFRTVHLNQRPFTCDKCEKSFGHKHLLIRHSRVHEPRMDNEETEQAEPLDRYEASVTDLCGIDYDSRSFVCTMAFCGHRFQKKSDLFTHLSTIHKDIQVYCAFSNPLSI